MVGSVLQVRIFLLHRFSNLIKLYRRKYLLLVPYSLIYYKSNHGTVYAWFLKKKKMNISEPLHII
jgi:hypothetical protein